LHEVAAGLIPPSTVVPARTEIVTRARVVRVTLRPTPAPPTTPMPTPTPVPVVNRPQRIVPPRPHASTRGAPARLQLSRPSNSRPVWEVASGHAGSDVSLAGNGTSAGNGSGTQSNGSAAAIGDEPCGFVTFSDPHGSQFDPRTGGFRVDIRMSVHFADGSARSMILDYPWYYASESANPWSDQNLRDPNFPTRFQPPPPEKIDGEPPLVKYVIEHSTSDGMTLLKDCPTATPSPSA
jgi:hypothetical protein